MKNRLVSCCFALMLTGCSIQGDQSDSPSVSLMRSHCDDLGYCYQVPSVLQSAIGEEDVTVFSTNSDSTELEDRYRIQPYHRLSSSCFPSLAGASQTTVLAEAGAKAEWGLVDFWDIYDSGQGWIDYDGEPPVCRSSDSPSGASYAFCSEKEEKTVVICVTQQTNNAALAKDIFETFRWTE